MDDEGNIKHTEFRKTIIKSAAAFTYQEAQSKIDDLNDQYGCMERPREY